MLPHEQRVVDEAVELKEKIDKLFAFFSSDLFEDLDKINKELLNRQHSAMLEYYSILQQRITLF